ncbi:DUF7159 family protein [Mycobacterium sp.]|uniref:DUF7159 family protein n=1 Tax=Mycobacterium sp. TaxID=1785 RepID=UPI003BAAFE82
MGFALGLAMSSTWVRFLLVEGSDGCGGLVECDEFEVSRAGGVSAPSISEHVVSVVLGTQAVAAARGHVLARVAITWTEDVGTEASLVVESLSCLGIDTVVAVPMLDAAEAVACRVAESGGVATTAVFVVESDSAVATVVGAGGSVSDVESQVYRGCFGSGEALRSLVVSMLAHLSDQPDVVFVAGAVGDFDEVVGCLGEVSGVSVCAVEQAGLALARGAVIAAAGSVSGGCVGELSQQGGVGGLGAESVCGDGSSLPLLFVPRTARLAMLDGLSTVEVADSVVGSDRRRRAVTSAHVLSVVLIGAVVSFLVSTTLAFSNKSVAGSSSVDSSGSGERRLTASASDSSGVAAAAEQPLFIPSLNGLSSDVSPAGSAGVSGPAPSVDDQSGVGSAGPPAILAAGKPQVAPDVVAILQNLFKGASPNPNILGIPHGTPPQNPPLNDQGGSDSSVAPLPEPLMLAISGLHRIAIPGPNLPTQNSAGKR